MSMSYTHLNKKFSEECVGLCEEMGVWVFNPSLNCSRLTEVERRCVGSEFQTTGAATWKLRWPKRVLVRGTSMSQRSAERRCARPEMSAIDTQTSLKVGWAGAVDTVKSSYGQLVKDS